MKKFSKIMTVVLCLSLCVFALTGCNKYNAVLKAFEKAEYTESSSTSEAGAVSFGDDVEVKVHILTSKNKLTYVTIFEFSSSKELQKQIKENEDLKKLMEGLQESDIVNGNCVCIAFGLDMANAYDIFKNA